MEVREHARSFEESYAKSQWNSKAARKLKGVTGVCVQCYSNAPCMHHWGSKSQKEYHELHHNHRRAVVRNTERHAQYQRCIQSAPGVVCAAHGQSGACRHTQLYLPHDQGFGQTKHLVFKGVMARWALHNKTAWAS